MGILHDRFRYLGIRHPDLPAKISADPRSICHCRPAARWLHGFDFVLESYTLQVLPPELRARAMENVAGFVKEGGNLLLIARGRDENGPCGEMPWPLTRKELNHFTAIGLRELAFEDYQDSEDPPVRRFRALYIRPGGKVVE